MRITRRQDRLDLLDTFVRVGESGSLSKAAGLLGTSQPTVSRRLSELEALLGCKLALRTTSNLSLTDEGRSLLVEARDLNDRWSALSQRLSGRQSKPDGTLRIIGPAGYGTGFLTDAVTNLMASNPDLRVEMSLTDRTIDLTATGAECWVYVGEIRDPELVTRQLGFMERVLLAAPSYLASVGRVTLKRLPQMRFVGLTPHVMGTVRLVDTHGRYRTIPIDVGLKTDSLPSSYRAILNGAGIGAAAPWMCQADLAAGKVVRVLPRWSVTPIAINVAMPPGVYRPARVTAFIEQLRQQMRSLVGFHAA
jgi:DNA-binding transcriptional LysR family regulator